MQLLLSFLFNPAHVKHKSYYYEHDVQLREHGIQLSEPLSINPILQLIILIINIFTRM